MPWLGFSEQEKNAMSIIRPSALLAISLFAAGYLKADQRTLWVASVVAHGAGTAFDAYASYHRGPYEANSFLADPNGQFGNRALGVKIGIFAGVSALEYALIRWTSHRDSALAHALTKTFTVVNFSGGAAYLASGTRNLTIIK